MRIVSYSTFKSSNRSHTRSLYGHQPCRSRNSVGRSLEKLGVDGSSTESIDTGDGLVSVSPNRCSSSCHDRDEADRLVLADRFKDVERCAHITDGEGKACN